MTHTAVLSESTLFDRIGSSERASGRTVLCAVGLGVATVAAAFAFDARLAVGPIGSQMAAATPVAAPPPPVTQAAIPSSAYGVLVNPSFYGPAPVSLAQSAPLGSILERPPETAPAEMTASAEIVPMPPVAVGIGKPSSPLPASPPMPPAPPSEAATAPVTAELNERMPLPMPRPAEFRPTEKRVATAARPPSREAARQAKVAAPTAAAPDNRSFFEKLFGARQPSGQVLAYASPEDGAIANAPGTGFSPGSNYDRWTAIYDIAAHTVYMPNGERLEAHSGLGDRLDDPRHVNERNRGATPPSVYDLQLRESLFHGVQALRLTPVGGVNPYGRTGLLAHTYMLGPNGDSNGCVSFRNYARFLQAYQNGEVKRLVVVAHRT
jgi:hypothetical protein